MASSGNVKVVCRFRPQLANELSKGGNSIVRVDAGGTACQINGQRKATFSFDKIFADGCTQEEVYDYAAKPIVEDVLKGYNGTIFAYGQTSSGKTHTMEGPNVDSEERGIIPRIVYNIFSYIDLAPETLEFTVRVSYFEIYMERIRDLLTDGNVNLQIHENRERGVYVRHATELYMQDPEDVMAVMRSGAERRSVAATNMNDHSSRSHSVFLMEITQKDTIKGGLKTGKLFLVDLAGSEKVSKTGADGTVLDEAKNINKSLSALGLVIMSLTEGGNRQHVPYRDSKLTRILQESLGGNARTTMIICCSPSSYNEQETISTLRFGLRAKKIKNKAVVNVKYSAEELERQLEQAKKEIAKLTKKLAAAEQELEIWRSGGTVSEADRVQLGQATTSKILGDETAGESSTDPAAAGAVSEELAFLLEKEREELLRRESELLDEIDEKNKDIEYLNNEIELLSEDRVTITRLASEKADLEQRLQEMETREEELLAENAEFEAAVEEMAEHSLQLQANLDELMQEKGDVEEKVKQLQQQHHTLSSKVTDSLSQANAGTLEQPDTGVVAIDAQLISMSNEMKDLKAKTEELQKLSSQHDEEASAAKAQLTEELAKLKASNGQLQDKVKTLTSQHEALEKERDDLEAKYRESQSKMTSLMTQFEEQGNEEMRRALDEQREKQAEEHRGEVSSLRDQLKDRDAKLEGVQRELNDVSVELEGVKASLESQKVAVAEKERQVAELSRRSNESEEKARQSSALAKALQQTMGAVQKFRETTAASLRSKLTSHIDALKQKRGNELLLSNASDARVNALQERLEKAKQELHDVRQESKQRGQEVKMLKAQSEKRKERIKALEEHNLKTQADFEKRLEAAQRTATASARPAPVQRGARRAPQAAVVRRTGGAHAAAAGANQREVAKYWQQRDNSSITNQGQPLVGSYSQSDARSEQELMEPEFV